MYRVLFWIFFVFFIINVGIDSTEKYEQVFSGIISEIKTLIGGKELLYEKNYARIGVNTNNDLPLNKPLKFPRLTIIIRCVL